MATRQYIGARYVPKFYDYNGSPNWRAGVEYENLTIVTRNGNSYTSKKPVPSDVGEPENNPEYWVSTGLYNEQVEAYRQLTQAVASRVEEVDDKVDELATDTAQDIADEATARENADTALGTRVTSLENTRELNLSARRFLFVGDSYIASHNNTCVEIACSRLGITEFENVSVSGSSFRDGSFLSQIIGYTGDKTSITDIFVLGGLNDSFYTTVSSEVTTAIDTFCQYVKTNYPNAHLTVCFCGHAFDDSSVLSGRTWDKRYWARYAYKQVSTNGFTYEPDMYLALVLNATHMGSDRVHPNSFGQLALADSLMNYITKNDDHVLYPPYGLIPNILYTFEDNILDIIIHEAQNGYVVFNTANATLAGGIDYTLATFDTLYFNKPFSVPVIPRFESVSGVGRTNAECMLTFIGNKLNIKPITIASQSYQSYTFDANGRIYIYNMIVSMPASVLL